MYFYMNRLAKKWLLPFLLFSFTMVRAQNIVPNGNLEDVNICDEYHCPCSPRGWFIVKNAVPTGYYHLYPDRAASGKQYFNLHVVRNAGNRQYWQTKLLCKLVPGEQYEASIKVAEDKIGPNVNDIGFYLTNHFIFSREDTLLQPESYVGFADAKTSKLKNNWFLLKKEFTATAEAEYLIIGNFSAEDNKAILTKRNYDYQGITLKVDDISIIPRHAAGCLSYQANKDSLYAITKRHPRDTLKTNESVASAVIVQKKKIDTLQLSNVLFEFDKFKLINPDTLETFRKLLSNPTIKKIHVSGFTDDAGTRAYNAILSVKRAEEIARLLALKFGIDPSIIESEGKGISTFYADASMNRRVDIYVYYQ